MRGVVRGAETGRSGFGRTVAVRNSVGRSGITTLGFRASVETAVRNVEDPRVVVRFDRVGVGA